MLIEAEKRKSSKTGDKLHQTGDDYDGRESLSLLHGKLKQNGSGFFDFHDLSVSNSFTANNLSNEQRFHRKWTII